MSDKDDQAGELPTGPRATWREVAALAGVSQSAVSRTFTSGASVSPKTRAKVEAAANILGYRPSVLSRIIQTGQSSIVAIVAGGLYNPFFTEALDRLSRALHAAGNQIMFVRAESDRALDAIVDDLARYKVDAVVSALSIASAASASRLAEFRIPIVNLNSRFAGGWLRSVSSDNRRGAQMAVDLLVEGGRRRLCYVAGQPSRPQEERESGFMAACGAAGIAGERVTAGFDYDAGRRAALALFGEGAPPDGLFCVNDLVACGVIDALRHDLGLRVPDEVAVIGYDNIPMASWRAYDLTTIDQGFDDLIGAVIAMLSPEVDDVARIVSPRLISRGTTTKR